MNTKSDIIDSSSILISCERGLPKHFLLHCQDQNRKWLLVSTCPRQPLYAFHKVDDVDISACASWTMEQLYQSFRPSYIVQLKLSLRSPLGHRQGIYESCNCRAAYLVKSPHLILLQKGFSIPVLVIHIHGRSLNFDHLDLVEERVPQTAVGNLPSY